MSSDTEAANLSCLHVVRWRRMEKAGGGTTATAGVRRVLWSSPDPNNHLPGGCGGKLWLHQGGTLSHAARALGRPARRTWVLEGRMIGNYWPRLGAAPQPPIGPCAASVMRFTGGQGSKRGTAKTAPSACERTAGGQSTPPSAAPHLRAARLRLRAGRFRRPRAGPP